MPPWPERPSAIDSDVAESPYRSGYGVEDQVREPSIEERALIAKRRARDLAVRKKNQLSGPRGVLNMAGVAAIVFAVGAVLEHPPLVFGAGLTATLCGVLGFLGYQRGLDRVRARRGRWDTPDGEWRTHETRIRARSVLYAASEDEDYITWIVFEIPGDDWAAIDDLWLTDRGPGLAKADLRITWLEPANECLGVEAVGEPLPKHGALRLGAESYEGEDFAQAIADGFGWPDPEEAYEEGIDPGEGPIRRVPESELAPWMKDAVRDE